MEVDTSTEVRRNVITIQLIAAMKRLSRYAHRFLEWFCPPSLYEGVEGDLLQQYDDDVTQYGEKKANWNFTRNVLRFFRPEIILRNKLRIYLTDFMMLANYFVIAYRNVLKTKTFSAINIFGLAIGLAACLLIFQFVSFELSYDKFNEKFDRIYRVTNDRFQNGKLIQHGTIMYPTIGPTMAKDYEEIEMYSRLMPAGDLNARIGEQTFADMPCLFVDEHFLSLFTFPVLAGDRATALKDPYTIVLTETAAKTIFGVKDGDYSSVIGKTFLWGLDATPYTVKGVCGDAPTNSHIQFTVLASYATLIRPESKDADVSWTWSDMRHYIVLKPGVDYKEFEKKFPAFSDRYFQGDKVSGSIEKFYLQPLSEAHLYSDYEYDIAKKANGKTVWAMLLVALFILVIAWINYINLTTSRALDRAKEVGLRKVMGAHRSQLIRQFIFESIIITFTAFIVALLLIQVLQSTFNTVIGTELSLWKVFQTIDRSTIVILILVLITGALLSGFYPAFVLSSYQPVTVLKGKFQRSVGGSFLRKSLVVFQFSLSATLITGTIIVSDQLSFMNNADLGVDITNTLIVQPPELTAWDSTFIQRVESYKAELGQIPGVVSVTTSNSIPGRRLGRNFGIRLADQSADAKYTMSVMNVDYNYFDTYSIKLVTGRKFTPGDHKVNFRDINTVIINENASKLLGYGNPNEILGKEMVQGQGEYMRKYTIVGVVTDFHQESLKSPKEPMMFRPAYGTYHAASIKISTPDVEPLVDEVEKTFKKFFAGNLFQYDFLATRYQNQYRDDMRFGKVITVFTGLAIIVSCLGLIGLASYTAVQRTKEIGIRKVLGASLPNIVSLLTFDFVKLVLIASLLSLPLAYFGMQYWLQGYAYRVSLQWGQFALPVITVLLIAIVTISFLVLKTARRSPAETLKYE
jgi:putative ABC transport system permease protein